MFAYMERGTSNKKFVEDFGIKLYHSTFEDDIRSANAKYRQITQGNELVNKRATGPEKIAIGRELVLSVLLMYKGNFTKSLLKKQIEEACFIKGSDIYWIHACIEGGAVFYRDCLK